MRFTALLLLFLIFVVRAADQAEAPPAPAQPAAPEKPVGSVAPKKPVEPAGAAQPKKKEKANGSGDDKNIKNKFKPRIPKEKGAKLRPGASQSDERKKKAEQKRAQMKDRKPRQPGARGRGKDGRGKPRPPPKKGAKGQPKAHQKGQDKRDRGRGPRVRGDNAKGRGDPRRDLRQGKGRGDARKPPPQRDPRGRGRADPRDKRDPRGRGGRDPRDARKDPRGRGRVPPGRKAPPMPSNNHGPCQACYSVAASLDGYLGLDEEAQKKFDFNHHCDTFGKEYHLVLPPRGGSPVVQGPGMPDYSEKLKNGDEFKAAPEKAFEFFLKDFTKVCRTTFVKFGQKLNKLLGVPEQIQDEKQINKFKSTSRRDICAQFCQKPIHHRQKMEL